MSNIKKEKVAVALSGGVDSSVAAALLKKRGFDVYGVHMRLWFPSPQKRICKRPSESEKRAAIVAKTLNIPFFVFDLRNEFKKKIVDVFLKDCSAGITPNPCVICNNTVKFGLLLEKCKNLGADYIATGHYADKKRGKGYIKLLKGKDKEKDQSYFLWRLGQDQLRKIIFPLGKITKKEVKEKAKLFGLPTFEAKESQEICFIPKGDTSSFLKSRIKTKKGKITDANGNFLGWHEGLHFYTIGQRKGIKLPQGPYYVLNKDLKKNILVVTRNERDLNKNEVILEKINWISGKEHGLPITVEVKLRYRQKPEKAMILKSKNKSLKLIFKNPQRAVTPGQSAVFYKREELLGGGVIVR